MKPPPALLLALGLSLSFGAPVLFGATAGGHRPSSDVLIEGKSPDGTGFNCSGVYLGDGKVLTARHCMVSGAKFIVVQDSDGKLGAGVNAVWEWTSETADVAVIRTVESLDAASAKLACRVADIGETIEVVGNPLDMNFIHTWGRVAGAAIDTNKGANQNEVPIDAEIASGNSGGPVYDSAGYVIGIASEGEVGDESKGELGHVYFMVAAKEACEKYGNHHGIALPRPLAYLAHVLGLA
jgi:S1-C subfamily serine protease